MLETCNNAIIVYMFSFIGRLFGKGKKSEDEEVEEAKPYQKGDPIPYTTDFEGAVKIEVFARDCTRDNIAAVGQTIVRPAEINEIIKLLDSLAGEGERQLNTNECVEHTVTAYDKEEMPFAQVKFYDGHLMFENGRFIGSGASERVRKKQTELYELIKVNLD